MASTLLELARSNHEELEVGTNRIVKLLGTETKTHKQKLIQQVLAFLLVLDIPSKPCPRMRLVSRNAQCRPDMTCDTQSFRTVEKSAMYSRL